MNGAQDQDAPLHRRAAIVSTGDELTLGQMLDTNSRDISAMLMGAGIRPVEHVTLGDDRGSLAAAIRRLAVQVPLLIITGGLGPTLDDVTREALADAMSDRLVVDDAALAALEDLLRRRGRSMNDGLRRQTLRPSRATCLPNPVGTAPGLFATIMAEHAGGHRACDVFCLPGPPSEWKAMWAASVAPVLRADPAAVQFTHLLHTCGIGESDAAIRLGPMMDRARAPSVGITASGGLLTVRIRASGDSVSASASLKEVAAEARRRLAPHVFGEGADTLASVAVRELIRGSQRLAVAESCTGGGLGAVVTAVPGSSAAFVGGIISYANEVKVDHLRVDPAYLRDHGAVSRGVAQQMAEHALTTFGSDHALAITGIAGPDGGSEQKPVGTVYIAHAHRSSVPVSVASAMGLSTEVRRFLIPGTRADVRERATTAALTMLVLDLLRKDDPPTLPRLLWEIAEPRSGPER